MTMLKINSESIISNEPQLVVSSKLHTITEQSDEVEPVEKKHKSVGRKFIDIIRRKKN